MLAQAPRPLLRRCPLPLVTMALAAAVAGCGSSSGGAVTSKSAQEILAASKAAAAGASSVHVTATTGVLTLDVDLTHAGGTGHLSVGQQRLEMTRVGNTLYLKATPTILKNLGLPTSLPAGSWLKVPAEKKPQLAAFLEMNAQVNRQLQTEGRLTKGATTTVNGQPVVEVKQSAKLFTRTLYVATSGKPYPVEILVSGQVRGKTTFSEWNKSLTVAPPAKSTELSQLEKKPAF